MKRLIFFIAIQLFAISVFSQETRYIADTEVNTALSKGGQLYNINDSVSYVYTRPKPFKYIVHAAEDLYEGPKMLFRKESIWPVAGVTASTLLFIAFDEQITRTVQQFGRYINLTSANNAKNISPVDGIAVWVPTDLSSGLYYIGDGYTELLVNGSFYAYGLIKKDNRALRTAAQLSEGLISVGIWVQILKHVSGRATANAYNGQDRWRWLPDPLVYAKHVPQYDAFPSGHLAIGMTTVTIISLNYPEYKFIKPLGYSLLGLCGFAMINNGVHWMGDYPLAILMGYGFGKLIVNRGRYQVKKTDIPALSHYYQNKPKLKLSPTYLNYGVPGIKLALRF